MARVPYVDYDDADPDVRELYDAQFEMSGRLPNFHRILGHVPWMYRWWLGLQNSTHEGRLPPEIKRLVHVQTSIANRCAYCTAHNVQSARRAGIAEEKLAALDAGTAGPDLFSDAELAVIEWVTAVTRNEARRDMATFERLSAHFAPPEIVEITVICAVRTLSNRVQEALWTDLEGDEFPETKAVVDAGAAADSKTRLARYVRRWLLPQLEAERSNLESARAGDG